MVKEFISHEAGNQETWSCICGNDPVIHGFYHCDASGNGIEPMVQSGWTDLYLCARCGRIIRQSSLEIVRRKQSDEVVSR
jgi:hypothetical protein